MLHTSHIELDAAALQTNLDFIRSLIKNGKEDKEVRISSVVKGNAYGHGIELFVPLAEKCGIDHFSVFSADEAARVKNAATSNPTVMIMGMLDRPQLAWAIENELDFYCFDLDRLETALELAKKIGKPANIHLEMETGMNRTGLVKKELVQAFERIKAHPKNSTLKGFCTHFAGAESISNYYRVKKQRAAYKQGLKYLAKAGLSPKYRHTSCSAATLTIPSMHYDLVRIGILQYGFFPSRETLIQYLTKTKTTANPLKRIISWKSRVMDIKHVKTGEYIGYGTSYLANVPTKIATVPIGYGHGYSRVLSNRGRVLIRGKRVSVIGTVNMNMMCVDVTEIDVIEKGDEVVIIGHQGNLEVSVASFSEASNQVNYELLTRLPHDIPRKVIG